jgi:hypothetical protein
MSEQTQQQPMSAKTVVYRLPGMDSVTVRRDVEYQSTGAGPLVLDLYAPPETKPGHRIPAVILVAGYPDPGLERFLGCKFKEVGSSVSWSRLMAASGMVAITYTNREPVTDLDTLHDFVRQNAASLGVDEDRIGLWSSSGNVPVALSALMQSGRAFLRCAALCYGMTLDLDGSTGVAEASRAYGFIDACAGRSVEDLPRETPLFLARAGQEQFPHLNEAMERFLARAVASNLPVTFVNHPQGPHAFDLLDDSATTHEIVRQVLAFLRFHLLGAAGSR